MIDELKTQIKILEQENDDLRETLAGVPPKVRLVDNSISIQHWAVKLMAGSFAETLKSLSVDNYVTMDIDTEVGPVSVTLQYKHKKSPAEIQAELQKEIDRLKATVAELLEVRGTKIVV